MKKDKLDVIDYNIRVVNDNLKFTLAILTIFLLLSIFLVILFFLNLIDSNNKIEYKLVLSKDEIKDFCIENNFTDGYITNYEWEGIKLTCFKEVNDLHTYKEWK